jgi:hypothetical protein
MQELFVEFIKSYDLIMMEVLYNILIEIGILLNIVSLRKIKPVTLPG